MISQQSLFGDDLARLPLRPYCADDLTFGLKIRPRHTALKYPYIQLNPPTLRMWLIYDVDRAESPLTYEDKGLPTPAWCAVNPENSHYHVAWGLSAPVLTSDIARAAPMRYLCAIEAAFRERLQADIGYSGLITKNPIHKRWHTYIGNIALHELGYLADWVDLPKHAPKQWVIVDEIGLGRNCTLFDFVRIWAYKAIRKYSKENYHISVWNAWQNETYLKTCERNGEFLTPLQERECWHISKSIAKWVWRNFDWAQFVKATHTPEIQARRGKRGGVASGVSRWNASEDKRASARLMRAHGMSYRAIANELDISTDTAYTWINSVR